MQADLKQAIVFGLLVLESSKNVATACLVEDMMSSSMIDQRTLCYPVRSTTAAYGKPKNGKSWQILKCSIQHWRIVFQQPNPIKLQ